ncbi:MULTISPECIES: capsule biosynthesis protein [Bilophila]|uniref:capsule biosynthesis protein n=1 Tax=Bilophila TaxID=35832 RepID=UPI00257C229C|nr:capsule biosynthesis protein [Bilophila sp.]MBS5454433.1 capsule biosynthesis protein [Bilophila sp.]
MLKSDNPPPLTLAVQSGRRSFSSVRAYWGRLPRKGKIFACVVLLPTVAVFLYYLLWASPMYVSQTRFAIRSADSSGGGLDIASALLRSSSSTGADAHIVVEYIQSLDIIHDIDKELGVDLHFSDKGHDVFSRLTNNPTQDEQLRYWKWAVIPALDQDTGIITLETKAYSPEMAQKIAAAVLARSEALVNTMNLRAREDAVSLAQSEVQRAEARVRKAQEAMRNFRDAHTLLDPRVTAAGLQGVVTELEGEAVKLRAQLAEAQSFMRSSAPATKALQTRLKAVESQLDQEKQRLAGLRSQEGNLNAVVGEYEDLTIEAEFAQKQLVTAMSALESARVHEVAKSRYVVAFQQPTLPDESLYPRPFLFTAYVFIGALLLLGLGSLITASIREHAGF